MKLIAGLGNIGKKAGLSLVMHDHGIDVPADEVQLVPRAHGVEQGLNVQELRSAGEKHVFDEVGKVGDEAVVEGELTAEIVKCDRSTALKEHFRGYGLGYRAGFIDERACLADEVGAGSSVSFVEDAVHGTGFDVDEVGGVFVVEGKDLPLHEVLFHSPGPCFLPYGADP